MNDAPAPDLIDAYLDELQGRLRGTPGDIRRSVVECESHLRDRTAGFLTDGIEAETATRQAIAAFGPPETVAAELNRAHRPRAVRMLIAGLAGQAAHLVAVGLLAIGASGIVAWLLTELLGSRTVFADAPGTSYGAAACAHYLAVHPSARTCAQAALAEGRDDSLFQRAAAGVLGVLLIAGLWWWRRRASRRPLGEPPALSLAAALVGVAMFGAVGVVLTGYGVDRAVVNTGSGQWLSAGAVAIIVALGYASVGWRRLLSI